jgi:hypothetical protein
MTQLSVQVDGTLVRNGLQNLASDIPKVSRLTIYRTSQRIQQRMKKVGARPSYPINWASDKQRRAFFASNGFGGGIPYRRSNRYPSGWKVVQKGDTGYTVINEESAAQWVAGNAYGQRQSSIHAGRWPVFRDEADAEIKDLPAEIEREIVMVARRNGLTK